MTFHNLILCGFMGSGKSTIGRLLANELKIPFSETDEELLKNNEEFSSISQIINQKGEPFFRELEHKTLKELLHRATSSHQSMTKNQPTKQVISLGGGTICQEMNFSLFKKEDLIIYLQIPFEECAARIKEQEKDSKTPRRPLFTDINTAAALFNQRKPLYEKRSNIHIEVNSKSPQEIVSEIFLQLQG